MLCPRHPFHKPENQNTTAAAQHETLAILRFHPFIGHWSGSERESHRLVLRLLHRAGGALEPGPVSREAAHARPEDRVAALQEHRRVIQGAVRLGWVRFAANKRREGKGRGSGRETKQTRF